MTNKLEGVANGSNLPKVKRKRCRRIKSRSKFATPVGLIKPKFEHMPEIGTLVWYLPIKLESPNKQMHWRTKNAINKKIHQKLLYLMPKAIDAIELPCTIYLCRIAPRKFDYDNLVYSKKFLRDTLADFLIPGLAKGRADGDERITWIYEQESMGKGEYGVRVTFIYMPK